MQLDQKKRMGKDCVNDALGDIMQRHKRKLFFNLGSHKNIVLKFQLVFKIPRYLSGF